MAMSRASTGLVRSIRFSKKADLSEPLSNTGSRTSRPVVGTRLIPARGIVWPTQRISNGLKAVGAWRKSSPPELPDLCEAQLDDVDIREANLGRANLL
jgi:hypothetical protein